MADSSSQNFSTSGTAPSLPRTPQREYPIGFGQESQLIITEAPFSPPRRNSSLAFSQRPARTFIGLLNRQTPNVQPQTTEQSSCSQPNIGKKRILARACIHDDSSSVHVAQMQRTFQVAKAALHLEIIAASSPASSIESRMNLGQSSPLPIEHIEHHRAEERQPEADSKAWRYSMAPQSLAAVSIDVREPLPSPTLPDLSLQALVTGSEAVEPISSGFSSPVVLHFESDIPDAVVAVPPSSNRLRRCTKKVSLDSQRQPTADMMLHNELDQSLTELRMTSDGSEGDSTEESPIVSHLKRRSCGPSIDVGLPQSPDCGIYLSKTAKAAAESAKAKRRLLKDMFPLSRNKERQSGHEADSNAPSLVKQDLACPNTTLHHIGSITPCPDPSVHDTPLTSSMLRRPVSRYGAEVMLDDEGLPIPPHIIPLGASRATATGSPMPFARVRARPVVSQGESHKQQAPPSQNNWTVSHPQYPQQCSLNEHFQPGWYYAREPLRASARPIYSFSTAASKVSGSDQAPDSRIRDSYKTDTLTALAKPPSRYRKNGIGAAVAPRGVSRYYQRPLSSTRPDSSLRPSSGQTYAGEGEVRFRSSPPRELGPEPFLSHRRKRAADDSFIIEEDSVHSSRRLSPTLQLKGSDEMMDVDEQTKAAVRLSIFGTNTPEALHKARQGIKELSPNVQVFRRSKQGHFDGRKKRRPSYWDNDLKEVRDSPAGRGGVNSPVSAQASMQAEFEIASLGRSEMNLDENDLAGEVARAEEQLEKDPSTTQNGSTEDNEKMNVDFAGTTV
ncbi:hypothetical protein H2198_002632 [Neophaeococcomyces mojaviensis]|uniref:Uncharacterized protein n=1 Tax=Neophaeococcomyces mojaviensis TaxID=3383035 RepID=A0ACC3AE68_9EURO|nr:hypothetical protein H2198_002632 [Knufia sp. JES_112]